MNGIVAEQGDREIHVILDNLNTHKPKEDRWLKRHKNVRLHFTDLLLVAESGGVLVQHPESSGTAGSQFHLTPPASASDR